MDREAPQQLTPPILKSDEGFKNRWEIIPPIAKDDDTFTDADKFRRAVEMTEQGVQEILKKINARRAKEVFRKRIDEAQKKELEKLQNDNPGDAPD